jgi:spore coat polysaccharide biosynthesis protein SpsF
MQSTNTKVSIGIQARSTSKRFPNKVFQMIGNRMVIEHVIDSAKNCADYINRYAFSNRVSCDVFVLIPKGDPIKQALRMDSDFIIEGDENDVLSRYLHLARSEESDFLVRITADCPLIPPFLIFKCINAAVKNGFDYFSNVGDFPETIRTSIDGHDVEVISKHALDYLQKVATERDREHVTGLLRADVVPAHIRRGILIGHNDFSGIKLSIDTEEDLERVKVEFEKIQEKVDKAKSKYGKHAVHRF